MIYLMDWTISCSISRSVDYVPKEFTPMSTRVSANGAQDIGVRITQLLQ
jgi:hypothetical protein